MSQRNALVRTGNNLEKPAGSLRSAVNGASQVKKPDGSGLDAVRAAAANNIDVSMRVSHIGFVFDATASREDVWDPAKKAFKKMFRSLGDAPGLQLSVTNFGGNGHNTYRPWTSDIEALCREVDKIECRMGSTEINPCISRFVTHAEEGHDLPGTIIYVGDVYEETEEALEKTIALMVENKIKVFTFLDGNDSHAEIMFRRLAEGTGGAFARFGDDMPLEDLCEVIAVYAIAGMNALKRLENINAVKLLMPGLER